jgi:choline dehydrogenase-like flavoprotein
MPFADELVAGLEVTAQIEQPPCAENHVSLGNSRDCFGIPRAAVTARLGGVELQSHQATSRLLAGAFQTAGVAELESGAPARNRPFMGQGMGHHMCTTRMHDDPACGVVDRDCLVHGTENLYCAGSSVFATGGYANPTLTALALAVRLADHLKVIAGSPSSELETSLPVA